MVSGARKWKRDLLALKLIMKSIIHFKSAFFYGGIQKKYYTEETTIILDALYSTVCLRQIELSPWELCA